MKKLLFLLLQAFLCLGSAKDAGPSSLGRGYGAGNYAVSAQSSLSGDQKARLADVIYLTGVGPKVYQDFIKFWDGQKVGDFLQSVFHLAQQYPAGNIDTRNKYWKELFTYLLEREPQLYEKLKQFSRFSDFINQKGLGYAEYFDEVVEKAKENFKILEKVFSRYNSLKSIDDVNKWKQKIADLVIENNISTREALSRSKKIKDVIYYDFLEYDEFKFLTDLGFLDKTDELKLINGASLLASSQHLGSIAMATAYADYKKIKYLVSKNIKMPIEAKNLELYPRFFENSDFAEKFINVIMKLGLRNPADLLNNPIFMNDDTRKLSFGYEGNPDYFSDRLLKLLNFLNKNNYAHTIPIETYGNILKISPSKYDSSDTRNRLIDFINQEYIPTPSGDKLQKKTSSGYYEIKLGKSTLNNLDRFQAAKEFLDKNRIKHTIDNGDYEKADKSVQELINRRYLKIGNQWINKERVADIVHPVKPGIIFRR